jgi:SSS family solute:Na+ symporter
MFGLPLAPCVVAATLFSVFYVARGGLRNAVLADQVYFCLMYGGFAVLIAFLVARHGAPPFHPGALPATHLTWHGGMPPAAILVWYFIALSALVDPAFWQIANAARDPGTARRTVLISIGFWIVFDFMTTLSGLYARALLPDLRDPVFAFPELARATLPPLALGLFYLGMIATVMSTIDSYSFIAATTLGRDLVWRLRRESDDTRVPAYTRYGLWVAGAFAVLVALANPSVIALWHDIGSITTPTLLLPVGVALLGRGRLGSPATLTAMAAAFLTSLAWVLSRRFASGDPAGYPWNVEPIYAGLAVSLAVYAVGWSVARRSAAVAEPAGLSHSEGEPS